MTKLILISDTHEQHEQIPLEPADILLHAGDITFTGKHSRLTEFNDWLVSAQVHMGFKHCIGIPGNHDLSFEKDWETACAHVPAMRFLNQEVIEVGTEGLAIYGEPRQPEFNNWAFNVPRLDMEAVWRKVPTSIDILLTHGPAHGIGDKTKDGRSVGCIYQREWIEKHQPRLVVCGHVHEGYGLYMVGHTLVVNASSLAANYRSVNKPVTIDF